MHSHAQLPPLGQTPFGVVEQRRRPIFTKRCRCTRVEIILAKQLLAFFRQRRPLTTQIIRARHVLVAAAIRRSSHRAWFAAIPPPLLPPPVLHGRSARGRNSPPPSAHPAYIAGQRWVDVVVGRLRTMALDLQGWGGFCGPLRLYRPMSHDAARR